MNKNNITTNIFSVLAFLAIIIATYCLYITWNNGSVSTTSSSAMTNIANSRTFRVGYVKFAPCADINPETKELEGIFVDAIKEVAADMKYKVEFKETTLSTFAAALQADEFDFSIGPTFITPTRSVAVDFTQPLLALGNSGLVKKEKQSEFAEVTSLGTDGIKIAVLQGQAMEQFVKSRFPNANLIVIAGSDLTAPLLAVKSGQADIGLTNSVTVQQFAEKHPDTIPVFTDEKALSRLALAWVVRANDDKTKSFLNSSINWLVQSGKLKAIQEKYSIKLSELE